MKRRRRVRAATGMNYWPGYVDALTNVVMNLLFLIAMFGIALSVLNSDPRGSGKKSGSGRDEAGSVEAMQNTLPVTVPGGVQIVDLGGARRRAGAGWGPPDPAANGYGRAPAPVPGTGDGRLAGLASQGPVGPGGPAMAALGGAPGGRPAVAGASGADAGRSGLTRLADSGLPNSGSPYAGPASFRLANNGSVNKGAAITSATDAPAAAGTGPGQLGGGYPAAGLPARPVNFAVADAYRRSFMPGVRVTPRGAVGGGSLVSVGLAVGTEPVAALRQPSFRTALKAGFGANVDPGQTRVRLWTATRLIDPVMRRTAYLALIEARNQLIALGYPAAAIETRLVEGSSATRDEKQIFILAMPATNN